MRGKSLILLIGLTLALLALIARPAHAADIRTGERVVIAAGEVIDDDLIVSAQFIGFFTGNARMCVSSAGETPLPYSV